MTISAHSSPSSVLLEILVCRYECSKIVKEKRPISEIFIAVSHVWGNADWRQLECVEDEILVSEEKAHFITHDLPNVVGNTWFWIDILCVDQRDGDARLAVTQHIPSIFRAAIKTVVIRESTGFRDCCVEAARLSFEFMGKTHYGRPWKDQDEDIDFTEGMDGWQKLGLHLQREHAEDNIEDDVLSRLWPLQEIMMSNCVRFVKCKPVSFTGPATRGAGQGYDLIGSLSTLALAWDTIGSKDETNLWYRTGTGRWDFLDAFFHCSETRRGNTVTEIPELPRARDLCIHLSSMRRTSKPRDFILAIMPQYGFYRMPRNARRMTFTQLYIDCCHQLRGRDIEIGPLFIESSENPFDGRIGELRAGVPEPIYLGDLVKLFNGPVQRSPERSVDLLTLEKQPSKTGIAKAQALRTAELLNEMGRVTPGSDRHRVLQAFSTILGAIDWSEGSRVNAEKITHTEAISQLRGVSWETVALLAAMVGCGVPLSAFEWAEQHLEVLHLNIFQGRSFVALAPKHVADNDSWYFLREVDDYAMGRDGPMPRLSLLASTLGQDNILTQCIFPPDIALSDG
ncbi:hypothetical protein K438DRAFT_1572691 [Mycena galopus ATCC 62051]|nr:hypothetical protein K438DRAFT_1572691 [Mycena galopus ATCC 62051]